MSAPALPNRRRLISTCFQEFCLSVRVFIAVVVGVIFASCPPHQLAAQEPTRLLANPNFPVGIVPRAKLGSEKSFDYEFNDISVPTLQKWLNRIGVKLPVKLDGALTGWVWIERDKSWFDIAGYRVEGAIAAPMLSINDWNVSDARLRFGYLNGTWYVGSLRGAVASPIDKTQIGQFNTSARITTDQYANANVNVGIDQVQLRPLLAALGLEFDFDNKNGSLKLNVTVPLDTADQVKTWTATGSTEVTEFRSTLVQSAGNTTADLSLAEGKWEVKNGVLDIALQKIKFSGSGDLAGNAPFSLNAAGTSINATQLLEQINQTELAGQITGAVTLNALLSGDRIAGVTTAEAEVQSESLILFGETVARLKAHTQYRDARALLNIVSATIADGQVSGTLQWETAADIVNGLPASASLTVARVDLAKLKLINQNELRGVATGNVNLKTNSNDDADAKRARYDWSGDGNLFVHATGFQETNFGDAQITFRREPDTQELIAGVELKNGNGVIRSNLVAELTGQADQTGQTRPSNEVVATTDLLGGTMIKSFSASGTLADFDLVMRVGPDGGVLAPSRLQGNFKISGTPEQWLERGSAVLSNSIVKLSDRLLKVELAELSFNADEFRVSRFRVLEAAGRIAGAAIVRRQAQGDHLLRLRIVNLNLDPYLKLYKDALPPALKTLSAAAEVDVELTKPASDNSFTRGWKGHWDGSLPRLKLKGQPIGQLRATGTINNQEIKARLTGTLLAGTIDATLKLPLAALESDTIEPFELSGQLEGAELRRLVTVLDDRQRGKQFTGKFSMMATATGTDGDDLELTTELKIPNLIHKQKVLAHNLNARFKWADNVVLVQRVVGGLAGGTIAAQGKIKFRNDEQFAITGGSLNFAARRLDARRIASAVVPEYARYYGGEVSYRGAAHYRRGVQLAGMALINDGELFGLPVQLARGKVRASLAPDGQFLKLVSNDLHGTALGGQFEGQLKIDGGSQLTLATKGRLLRGQMEQLSRGLGFEQITGSEKFNGRFEIRSKRITSVDALTGDVEIQFESGDVKSIPLLSSLDRFVPLAQFASTTIESGSMHAQLGQGQLRISDLVLNSKAFVVAATGSASLTGKKLDVNAVLQTGGSVGQRIVNNLINRLLVGALPQIALLGQVNELIRNRTIFLHVGGSPTKPVVQIQPGQIAARAFLQNFGRTLSGNIPVLGN